MNYNSTNNYSNIIWYTTISTKIQINEFQKSIEHKRKHSSKSTKYNFLTKWKKKIENKLEFYFHAYFKSAWFILFLPYLFQITCNVMIFEFFQWNREFCCPCERKRIWHGTTPTVL